VGVCMVTYRGGFMVVGWRRGGSYMEVSWWFCGGEGGTVKVLGGVVSCGFGLYILASWAALSRYIM